MDNRTCGQKVGDILISLIEMVKLTYFIVILLLEYTWLILKSGTYLVNGSSSDAIRPF